MKKILMMACLLFISKLQAAKLVVKDEELHLQGTGKVELRSVIETCANLMGKTVIVPSNITKDLKKRIDLELNKPIAQSEVRSFLLRVLSMNDYNLLEDNNQMTLWKLRDSRYLPNDLHDFKSVPKDDGFYMAYTKTKYPLAHEITRSFRPFLSRYGRIISVEPNIMFIQNFGHSIPHFQKVVENTDTKENFDSYIKKKRERAQKSAKSKEESSKSEKSKRKPAILKKKRG